MKIDKLLDDLNSDDAKTVKELWTTTLDNLLALNLTKVQLTSAITQTNFIVDEYKKYFGEDYVNELKIKYVEFSEISLTAHGELDPDFKTKMDALPLPQLKKLLEYLVVEIRDRMGRDEITDESFK